MQDTWENIIKFSKRNEISFLHKEWQYLTIYVIHRNSEVVYIVAFFLILLQMQGYYTYSTWLWNVFYFLKAL
jgi:hypothetical protein